MCVSAYVRSASRSHFHHLYHHLLISIIYVDVAVILIIIIVVQGKPRGMSALGLAALNVESAFADAAIEGDLG